MVLSINDPIDREWVSLERIERQGTNGKLLRWRLDLASRQQRLLTVRSSGQIKAKDASISVENEVVS